MNQTTTVTHRADKRRARRRGAGHLPGRHRRGQRHLRDRTTHL